MKFAVFAIILLITASFICPPGETEEEINSSNTGRSQELLYKSLNDSSLSHLAFRLAMIGYESLTAECLISIDNLLTIIDYSKPSTEKRLYVIDLQNHKILIKALVAHGRNSGDLYATRFSNRTQSHQSALGFYLTGNTYTGSQGYSLLMAGIDTGYNDNARKRSIVIHSANYVTDSYAKQFGRLGRSFGCPALPPDQNATIIDIIKNGSLVFCYYPDKEYLSGSKILANINFKRELQEIL